MNDSIGLVPCLPRGHGAQLRRRRQTVQAGPPAVAASLHRARNIKTISGQTVSVSGGGGWAARRHLVWGATGTQGDLLQEEGDDQGGGDERHAG